MKTSDRTRRLLDHRLNPPSINNSPKLQGTFIITLKSSRKIDIDHLAGPLFTACVTRYMTATLSNIRASA